MSSWPSYFFNLPKINYILTTYFLKFSNMFATYMLYQSSCSSIIFTAPQGVGKWTWYRKRKLSEIQFLYLVRSSKYFWGLKIFFIEMSNFQNAISQKGLIEKFWFQWEMFTLTCLQHIPLTKLPRLFSSHDCPSRQVCTLTIRGNWCGDSRFVLLSRYFD